MNLLAATVYAYLENQVLLDLGQQGISLPWSDPRARELSRYHGEHVVVQVAELLVGLKVSVQLREGRNADLNVFTC